VEPLAAPEDTPVGERVRFGEGPQPEPATANQVRHAVFAKQESACLNARAQYVSCFEIRVPRNDAPY